MGLYALVMRPSPALLVAILVVATASPAAGLAAAPQVAAADGQGFQIMPINGTTNQLSIADSDLRTAEYNSAGIDVGTAVASGSRELHQEHETRAFEQRFIRAGSERARTELVTDRVDAVEQRRAALETRQRQVLAEYTSGAATVDDFVRVRALVDAEAGELLRSLSSIERADRNNPDFSMDRALRTDLENTKGTLRMLRGPVASTLGDSLAGADTASRVYLEASTDGYMLATVEDGRYVRETHLSGERSPGAEDQFATAEGDRLRNAADRAEALYPWLYDRQLPSVQSYGTTNIYQISADHSNGRLIAYLDGGTTDVFREVQYRQLSTVEPAETRTTVDGTVRVTVNRAYETGPVLVTVSNNATGVPVSGTVSVDGQAVGSTGADGQLWTVEPRDSYTVTVNTTDGERVDVAVPER